MKEAAQMTRARMKAQTGNSVFHLSMVDTPNANVITVKDFRIQPHLTFMIDERTEDGEIPPIGDLLINRHQMSMDIRLLRLFTTSISPDQLAVVEKGVHRDCGD